MEDGRWQIIKVKIEIAARWNEKLFMTILALDFSSPQRSVAVLRPNFRRDELHESLSLFSSESQGLVELVPPIQLSKWSRPAARDERVRMIEQALTETKIEREQIDVLAVGLGPGSYTGIRALFRWRRAGNWRAA